MASSEPARLERLPAFAWCVIAVVALSVVYTIIDVAFVRPYLWPAGAGATYQGDTSTDVPLKARPPQVATNPLHPPIVSVVPGGSAWSAGVRDNEFLSAMARAGETPAHVVDTVGGD